MPKYQILPDRSQVWIEARSSLHPVHGDAEGLEGEIDVAAADADGGSAGLSGGRVELDVGRLRSGNPAYDAQMARVIEARKYPKITGVALEVRPAGQADRFQIRGDLTFHGVTRTVNGEVTVQSADDQSVVVEGEQVFDIRDFNVQPPKILMLRVHPDVRVRIRVEARRSE